MTRGWTDHESDEPAPGGGPDATTRLGLDPWIGRTLLGRYRIESLLGAGGYGAVYEATQLSVNRRVAVKLLHPSAAESSVEEARFVREAQALSGLSHPNIVQLIDFGRTPVGHTFIVSELIRGKPLDALLRRDGAFAPRRAARLVDQILSALTEAHEHGIVHRDLKPANLMVTTHRDGTESVKLIDFGIARTRQEGQPHLTQATSILGTPRYLAPERWIGEPADERTDLYALGLIVHELLTGRPAIRGDVIDCREAHLTGAIPPLPEDVPQALRRLVAECISRSPAARPTTARDARARLFDGPSGELGLAWDDTATATTASVGPVRVSTAEPPRSDEDGPEGGTARSRWRLGALLVLWCVAIGATAWAVASRFTAGPVEPQSQAGQAAPPIAGSKPMAPRAERPEVAAAVVPAPPREPPRAPDAPQLANRVTVARRWLDVASSRAGRQPPEPTSALEPLEWIVHAQAPKAVLVAPDGSELPGAGPWRFGGTRYSDDRTFTIKARGYEPTPVLVGPSVAPGELRVVLQRTRTPRHRPAPLDSPLDLREEPIDVPL